MNKVISISIYLLLLIACKEAKLISNSCNVMNPVSDLQWISTQVQELEQNVNTTSQYFYLTQATYNNESVFIFDNCCPFCNTISEVQSCDGENLGALGTDIDPTELSELKVIWKHPDSPCIF